MRTQRNNACIMPRKGNSSRGMVRAVSEGRVGVSHVVQGIPCEGGFNLTGACGLECTKQNAA